MEVKELLTLRAMEPYDVDFLIKWENDPRIWQYSNTIIPFSRHTLEEYVMNASNDIYMDKQLRLMIDVDNVTVGCVDMFDFDPFHRRAAVGILIDVKYRGHGYAMESIRQMAEFAFDKLQLKQLYCDVSKNNEEAMHVFQKIGFEVTGEKHAWRRNNGVWEDYYFLQFINKNQN